MPRAVIPPRFAGPIQLQQLATRQRDMLGAVDGALTVADLSGIGTITVIDNGSGGLDIASDTPTRAQLAFDRQ